MSTLPALMVRIGSIYDGFKFPIKKKNNLPQWRQMALGIVGSMLACSRQFR
jgi:hypothetical protein